jgi:hypothetical protein
MQENVYTYEITEKIKPGENNSNTYLVDLTFNEIVNENEVRYKFDSRLITEEDLLSEDFGLRLLEVDNRLNIIKNVTTCFLISSTDVLHS